MRPDHGGRLEVKLASASDASARYTLTIFTPNADLTTEVVIDAASGGLELGDWEGGLPPKWLRGVAHALLRTVWRNKTSDGEWPRRLTRWRPDPKP